MSTQYYFSYLTQDYHTLSLPQHKQWNNIHLHKEGSNTAWEVTTGNVKNACSSYETNIYIQYLSVAIFAKYGRSVEIKWTKFTRHIANVMKIQLNEFKAIQCMQHSLVGQSQTGRWFNIETFRFHLFEYIDINLNKSLYQKYSYLRSGV